MGSASIKKGGYNSEDRLRMRDRAFPDDSWSELICRQSMNDALGTFRRAFAGWVASYSDATSISVDPANLLLTLNSRISDDVQRQIGSAFINGWLESEQAAHRGYYVRETDRPGTAGGQYMITHAGGGETAPCWESYIQLADYAKLRTVAEPRGLQVRLEDHLMDITVWAGERLVLYVENKTTKAQALSLLKKMKRYGEIGFSMDDLDKSNDPLRKAKYLFRNNVRPQYFALSAVDYRQLFSVTYLESENRFKLIERLDPFTAPLQEATIVGRPPARSAADSFALELSRFAGDRVWVSPGTGQTAFNVYFPIKGSDYIVLGVYETAEVWTDLKPLGPHLSERLATQLSKFGITIDVAKDWAFWMKNEQRFRLGELNDAAIAAAVVEALFPNHGGSASR